LGGGGGVQRRVYYAFEINPSSYHPSFGSSPYHPIVKILRTTLCKDPSLACKPRCALG
jgi:hypothetical protein